MTVSALTEIVRAQKRGEPRGIVSICSANPLVLEASLDDGLRRDRPVLIESTCNQVNQFGGYTGMTPAQFATFVYRLAGRVGFPPELLVLGGDHLGPGPWQREPASRAMDKAAVLVADAVRAGYRKIHLDASMKLADDDPTLPLDTSISAARAAELAVVAETTFHSLNDGSDEPSYVIGTEVPLPGGAQEGEHAPVVTSAKDLAETIEATRDAFFQRGLEATWQRVIAVVVQPGVEYGDASLFEYDRAAARPLAKFIEGSELLVYEAHSTDYQTAVSLQQMVEDHFAILKVGPALTFALREGILALSMIEEELLVGRQMPRPSRLRQVLEEAMLADPAHWRNYYPGEAREQKLARMYSYSDRSRYYWPVPKVQTALAQLINNLERLGLPLNILSQYLPVQYKRVREGHLANTPHAMLLDKVTEVLADYAFACG